MIMLMWNKCSCCLLLLAAVLIVESSQLDSSSSKVNSIKSTLMGEAPTQATNRSAGIHQGLMLASSKKGKMLEQMGKPPKHYHRQGEAASIPCAKECLTVDFSLPRQAYPCTNDKECEVGRYCHSPHQATSACMMCRRKKKRCHRDGMCCPGNRCNNGICIPVTESILTPHIPALEGPRNKKNGHYAGKDLGWHNLGRPRSKLSHIKGHEGDPCLRSSDCIEGHCCARHFWTKICKPVLHQGEVCTKQRKKGSHGLEIFQRCDCAKGLSCKVWKDATSSSKSRLHVCQKI
ncbi:dickkopf-related protein 2 isoform X1 [Motacilla alba alba]|uniref:dickkopf-related protein 2 isoform X1 n=2 Tax=Motacilla alba alba TaxID=1094192 RepID=UPI0018D58E88|nr:dickkopf-related protein 2 isoform X1 [Motacilla alba alba]